MGAVEEKRRKDMEEQQRLADERRRSLDSQRRLQAVALEQKRRKDMEDHKKNLENERQLSSEAQTRLQAAAAEQSLRKGFEEHKRLDDVQRRANLKRVTVPQKLRTVDDERPRAIETQSLVPGTQRLDHADDTVKPWQVAQMAGGEGRAKKVPILPTEIPQ